MRIDASSFNVDMNAMLNQLNNQNGLARADSIYKKAVADITPKIKSTNNSIKANVKNIQNVIKSRDEDNQEKLAQIHSYEAEIHKELGSQIDSIRQENQDIINNNIPQAVQNGMSQVRNDFPTNEVCYMPSGQFPQYASPGDICWQSGDFSSNTDINAKAFRYNGYQWQPLKVDTDIFGDNIFGADIHGGNIYGANFVSEDHGVDGKANFSVSPQGDIYARNFAMDLMQNTTGGSLNRITYNTDNQGAKGLNFNNGILNMTADAYQDTGTYINENASNYTGYTFLEPDYLKLRTTVLDEPESNLIGRTDIRGGNLELSDNWNQNTGIRLGYWFDNNGFEGPDIVVGDLNKNSTFSAIGASGIATTTMNVSGTLTVNGRNVTGKQRPPFDPTDLQNQINANVSTLNDHKIRLDGHDYRLDQHKDTLIDHTNHLSDHDTQLSQHEDQINSLNSQVIGQNTTIEGIGQKVNINNENTLPNIRDTSINLYNNRIWSNYQPMFETSTASPGTVWFYSDGGYVDIKAAGVYSNDNEINSDRSLKKDITPVNSKTALAQVLGTDIVSYHYKNGNRNKRKNVGPIIDDQNTNSNQKYYTPNNLIDYDNENGDAFILNNAVSYLFLSIQELEKQNSQLTQRVAKLEFEKQGD